MGRSPPLTWPDDIDDILGGDLTAALVGLRTRFALGWLEVEGGHTRFFPHSTGGFTAPPNKTVLLLANGYLARRGLRRARRRQTGTTSSPT